MKRLIKLCRAREYLDMSEPEFNKKVRPFVTEIKDGRVIKFDIIDLDAWVEHYKAANGRPAQEETTWQKEPQALEKREKSGTSKKLSPVSSFGSALEKRNSKRQSAS